MSKDNGSREGRSTPAEPFLPPSDGGPGAADPDAEAELVASLLFDPEYCWAYIKDLPADLLTEPSYRAIFDAGKRQIEGRQPGQRWPTGKDIIDALPAGWKPVAEDLFRKACTATRIEVACDKVHKAATRRAKIDHYRQRYLALISGEADDDEAAFEPWRPFEADRESPPCPVDALPPTLRDAARYVAQSRQVPIELPVMIGLGVIATGIQGKVRVKLAHHEEPTNIYVAVSMPSGTRKSGAFNDMVSVIYDAERDLRDRQRPAICQAQAGRSVIEQALKKKEQEAAREQDPTQRGMLVHGAADLRMELEQMRVPSPLQLFCQDATPEAVAKLITDHAGRLSLFEPEGACLLALLNGRHDAAHLANYEVFLRCYGGDPLRVDRKGEARSEYALQPALTVVTTLQPLVLRQLLGDREMNARGLVARFAFVEPSSLIGSRLYRGAEDDGSLNTFRATVRRLFDTSEERWLQLTAGAQAIWTGFHDRIERQMAPGGRLGAEEVASWASRLAGRAARFAGLLHVVERSTEEPIEADTMRAAVDLAEWLLDCALPLLGQVAPDVLLAQRLLGWIRREPNREFFNLRTAYRATFGGKFKDGADAAELLVLRGYIARIARASGEMGRPPSETFRVNPKAHGATIGSIVSLSEGSRSEEEEGENLRNPSTDSMTILPKVPNRPVEQTGMPTEPRMRV